MKILEQKCTLCGKCSKICSVGAIRFNGKSYYIDKVCRFCGMCLTECKAEAISNPKSECAINLEKNLYKDIWVYCEQENGFIKGVSLELLGQGKKLADQLGVKLCAVLIGNNLDKVVNQIVFYGIDQLILVDNPNFEYYNDEIYSDIFSSLINNYKPEIVLVGSTYIGRSLAPRVATKLGTGLTADCTQLEVDIDNRSLLQTRPTFGGNLFATITCPEQRPQMATVRPGIFALAVCDISKSAEIIAPDVLNFKETNTKVIKTIINQNSKNDKFNKDIMVAFGRGVGSLENIRLIKEFTHMIGGTLGATRAAVDAGWIDYSYQVGQTGKTVAPKIYIALGISGAIQHIAGMMSSEVVIAVNKDKNAPIFKLSTIGIVCEVSEILPLLIEEIKEISLKNNNMYNQK